MAEGSSNAGVASRLFPTGVDGGQIGYRSRMTNETTSAESSARLEAVQAVVDRVSGWQHSATDGTIVEELRKGLDEAGVELDDSQIQRLADAIEADDGPVDAAQVVG